MAWPGVSDYQEAVQGPQLCFGDPALKQGSPVLTKLGLPRPISGGNASVYQIRSGRSEYAVRCFLRNIPDIQKRYAAIGAHLEQSALRSAVGFEYLQDGIRIRGQWYPVLKMEWVRGAPLNEHVRDLLGDPKGLRALAADWAALMVELERAQIAHGDLQHGNVMVARGQLVLIDYDGMYVPALRGSPGHELGHPSYQHPRREGADFGPEIDRFAALAIHTALLALAERPELWATYDNSDNVLFTRGDFEEPQSSELFAALQQLGDAAVQTGVRALLAACAGRVADVPRLADVIAGAAGQGKGKAKKAKGQQAKASPTPAVAPAPAPAVRRAAAPAPAGGGKPQWLASLMAAAPAAVLGNDALSERWRHRMPGAVTRAAALSRARRPARERAIVVAVLLVLVQFATWALWPRLLPATAGAALWLVWMAARRRARRARKAPAVLPSAAIAAVAFSPDGSRVAVVGGDGIAEVLDVHGGQRTHRLLSSTPSLVGVAPLGGDRFATVVADGTVQLHDGAGAIVRTLRQPHTVCAAASPEGTSLAVGTVERQVRVVGLVGREQVALSGHGDRVQAVCWSSDGLRLVSGSADHTVRLWSLQARTCEHVLQDHRAPVESVAISGNGRFVAAGAADGRVRIWDGRRQKLLHTIDTGTRGVAALAFAPDAAVLLAGCADGSVRAIDAIGGKVLARQQAHAAAVTALAIGPDGSAVVSADRAGTLLAWSRVARPVANGAARAGVAPAAMQLARP
ncbi:MAG: hypothetical protein AB7O97_16450 [Planctomycetota bacterium]